MKRAIVVTGVIAATIAGSGVAALAVSSASPNGATSPPAATSAATAARPSLLKGLRHVVQARVVTRGQDGTFVTHDVIVGKVTQVSPTSITVRAADGASDVYAVNSSTKVVIRVNGNGSKGAISDVHVGDAAVVTGTGVAALTAKHIVDRPANATAPTPSSPTGTS